MTTAARRGRLKVVETRCNNAFGHRTSQHIVAQNSACPMAMHPLHVVSVTSTSRVPYSSASEHTAPLQLYQTATSILWWLLQSHRRKTRMLRSREGKCKTQVISRSTLASRSTIRSGGHQLFICIGFASCESPSDRF